MLFNKSSVYPAFLLLIAFLSNCQNRNSTQNPFIGTYSVSFGYTYHCGDSVSSALYSFDTVPGTSSIVISEVPGVIDQVLVSSLMFDEDYYVTITNSNIYGTNVDGDCSLSGTLNGSSLSFTPQCLAWSFYPSGGPELICPGPNADVTIPSGLDPFPLVGIKH